MVPRPKTAKEVRRFMGSAGYYRCYVESFARLGASIHRTVKSDVDPNDIDAAWTMPLPKGHPREATHWRTPKGKLVVSIESVGEVRGRGEEAWQLARPSSRHKGVHYQP